MVVPEPLIIIKHKSYSACTERTLQSLFCLYGRLDRVVMYRNRSNGELKGDGLIVFGRDAAEEYRVKNNDNSIDLVEHVCTQMNGAELPDGTIIRAEPADLDYNKKKPRIQQEDQTQQNGKIMAAEDGKEVGSKAIQVDPKQPPKEEEEDDDLDDFFASLE